MSTIASIFARQRFTEQSRSHCRMLARVAWLLPLMLASCLEFEHQEVHLRYDAKVDRMDVLLVYRGLYAANTPLIGNNQPPVERALADLKTAREHGAFAFRNSMNFKVDPVTESMDDWVSRHIDVENGGLFTDPKGRLCGYQFVRIRGFRAFLPRFDEEHREIMFGQFGPSVSLEKGWPEPVKKAFQRYVKQGNAVITADGCCFEVRLPIREQDHAQVQRYVLGDPALGQKKPSGADVAKPKEHSSADPRRIKRRQSEGAPLPSHTPNALTVRRADGVTIVRYGTPGAAAMRVEVQCEGKGDTKLLDALRKQGEPIEAGVPDQALQRRFEAFCTRDAKLPPELAKLRR
ncbi:hypothetical protein N8467_00265 [bacterium]|nr:hypothetical protein [bacterium]